IEGVKIGAGTHKRLADVPFRITSKTTGENHVVVTDDNGQFSTSAEWASHKHNTNAGKTSEDGVWFGTSEPDDSKGALPYDTYIIEEMRCDSNKGFELIPPFEIVVSRNNLVIDLGTLTDEYEKEISIHTTATSKDGEKTILAGKEVTIVDTVKLDGLTKGSKYQLKGWQMLKEENAELVIDGKRVENDYTFVADDEEMKIEITYTFNASELGGKNLVTFEELYDLSNSDEPVKVAEHKDIKDDGQTVLITERIIKIHTTAKEPNHQVQNFFQSEYYDFDPVLKLSDYNRLLELRKMPLLSLNDNEYYIVTNSKFAYEVEDNKDIETITVANKNLKLKGYDTKSYWNSITNTGRFVVVLPDKYVQGLEVSENHLIIDTKEETDAELENKIKEDMQHQLVKVDKNGEINDESYRVNVRGAEIEQQKAMVAIVASLFMYIAFILISAVGTILAVQSLSDSTKYKYRYLTLRRLGINDKSLFKTIRKQLLILFCVPAISAILCSFVMMSSLNNVYQQILGDKHLYLIYFGLNLIIFFLIYSIYWIATYIGFKRNINEES
ncbi:VaFE repeat-containing surface-anchored protein, partial [Coprococcus comes]|uniref:VaFE repeat-containing surface-anchored protein n=1 Tax=Coprococcus comes TaxID=410072 RepID=UPI001FBB5D1A